MSHHPLPTRPASVPLMHSAESLGALDRMELLQVAKGLGLTQRLNQRTDSADIMSQILARQQQHPVDAETVRCYRLAAAQGHADSVGARLLRLCGWTGGGLGPEGRGIAGLLLVQPCAAVALTLLFNRKYSTAFGAYGTPGRFIHLRCIQRPLSLLTLLSRTR